MEHDKEREAVKNMIRNWADAADLGFSGLARRAGLAPSTLTRFMNGPGKHILSHRTLAKLSAAVGPSLNHTAADAYYALVGSRMRKVRQAMASQSSDEEVAAVLGWSVKQMEEIFMGRWRPDLHELLAFARRMRVTTDFLLSGDPETLPVRSIARLQQACPDLLSDEGDIELHTGTDLRERRRSRSR
jgi:transcriptional regulator with XRE-family HTH domain